MSYLCFRPSLQASPKVAAAVRFNPSSVATIPTTVTYTTREVTYAHAVRLIIMGN